MSLFEADKKFLENLLSTKDREIEVYYLILLIMLIETKEWVKAKWDGKLRATERKEWLT